MTDAEFLAWAEKPSRRLNVLLEADALVDGVTETTFYFSSRPFASAPTDAPANQLYQAVLVDGASTVAQLALSGAGGMTVGDAELDNTDRALDPLLDHVWTKRPHRYYVGDVSWPRSDYRLVFDGLSSQMTGRDRKHLNLNCRDKLEQLNTSVSTTKLGGATENKDRMVPGTFGEVFNITPLFADPATDKQQVHTGAIEDVIENRDNGVPEAITEDLASGTYTLNASPVNGGVITCSVQGDKGGGVYRNTVSTLVQRLAIGFGTDPFVAGDLDAANLAAFDAANPQCVGLHIASPDSEQVLSACQQLAASVGAQVIMSDTSQLQLVKIELPAPGAVTTVTAADMAERSLEISDRPGVRAAVKIGYCRNYTPQTNLQTGIPQEHKDLFAQEWRTVTESDAGVAADYKLTTEPEQENTLLLKRTDALAEAQRRLALWSVPRTIYRFVGMPRLMLLQLGAAIEIVHDTYNLQAGVTGQIVRVERDWLRMRVTLEVLV